MGLFSKFKKLGKGVGKQIAGGLDLLTAVFARPVETSKGLVKAVTKRDPAILKTVKEVKQQSPFKTIGATVRNTALAAAALTPVRSATLAKGALSKIFIGKTVTSTAARVGGAVFAGGLVAGSQKARKAVVTATNPGLIVEKGFKTGKLLDDPGKAKDQFTDKGILGTVKDLGVKGAVIAGGAALVGAGAVAGGKAIKAFGDKEKPLEASPLVAERPIINDVPTKTIGTVKEVPKTETMKGVTPVKVTQKVNVNQKVYKAGSVEAKYVQNGRRKRRRK